MRDEIPSLLCGLSSLQSVDWEVEFFFIRVKKREFHSPHPTLSLSLSHAALRARVRRHRQGTHDRLAKDKVEEGRTFQKGEKEGQEVGEEIRRQTQGKAAVVSQMKGEKKRHEKISLRASPLG